MEELGSVFMNYTSFLLCLQLRNLFQIFLKDIVKHHIEAHNYLQFSSRVTMLSVLYRHTHGTQSYIQANYPYAQMLPQLYFILYLLFSFISKIY